MIPHVDALAAYPRIRFMGSKHRLAPRLGELFATLPPGPAIDAFSGSGVVAYTLKAGGREVLANDHLTFTATLAEALVANADEQLSAGRRRPPLLAQPRRPRLHRHARSRACTSRTPTTRSWTRPGRTSTSSTGAKRALALSSLCLAAAWKQPRGVFTVTTPRYDDGRRQLHTSLERSSARRSAAATPPSSRVRRAPAAAATSSRVDPAGAALVYLDPPYAPPRDDTCYVKRYHFLEGLATYWRGQEIMWETKTRKLRKRETPFGSKRTVRVALDRLFDHFSAPTTLVVSYGSNADLDAVELEALLARHRGSVRRIEIPHSYAFGTHRAATRRIATEYVFVAS